MKKPPDLRLAVFYKKLQAQCFNRAGRNAGAAFDATVAFINDFAIFHFKNFNWAGADAGATTNTLFTVNFDSHYGLLDSAIRAD